MGDTEQELVHRHERSDVAARWPLMIGAGFLLLLPLAAALVALLMNTLWLTPPAPPEMFAGEPRIAEAPQLLVHPQSRLAALRAEWLERLTSYGWVDREQGIVHIPIKIAMQRLAAQGAAPGAQDKRQAPAHSGSRAKQPDPGHVKQLREQTDG